MIKNISSFSKEKEAKRRNTRDKHNNENQRLTRNPRSLQFPPSPEASATTQTQRQKYNTPTAFLNPEERPDTTQTKENPPRAKTLTAGCLIRTNSTEPRMRHLSNTTNKTMKLLSPTTSILIQPRLRALLDGLGYYLRFLNSLSPSISVT